MQENNMPHSCYTVLQLLEKTGIQTHKDLVHGTGLAPRTVRYALRMLKEHGLVIEKFNFHDARQMLYYPTHPVSSTQVAV